MFEFEVEKILEYRGKLKVGELIAHPEDTGWIVKAIAKHHTSDFVFFKETFLDEQSAVSAMPVIADQLNNLTHSFA